MIKLEIEISSDDLVAMDMMGQCLSQIAKHKTKNKLPTVDEAKDLISKVAKTDKPLTTKTETPSTDARDKAAADAKAGLEDATSAGPGDPKDLGPDTNGIPWDARIHSKEKTKKKDGTWKVTRNLNEGFVESIVAELKAKSETVEGPPKDDDPVDPPPQDEAAVEGPPQGEAAVEGPPQDDAPVAPTIVLLTVKVGKITKAKRATMEEIDAIASIHGFSTFREFMSTQDNEKIVSFNKALDAIK